MKEIYSMWSHWVKGQRDPGTLPSPSPSAQDHLQGPDMRFRFKWRRMHICIVLIKVWSHPASLFRFQSPLQGPMTCSARWNLFLVSDWCEVSAFSFFQHKTPEEISISQGPFFFYRMITKERGTKFVLEYFQSSWDDYQGLKDRNHWVFERSIENKKSTKIILILVCGEKLWNQNNLILKCQQNQTLCYCC